MRKRTALLARLERLERQQQRRPLPRLVFKLCPQEQAGEIVGFNVGNVHVVREAGETAEQCAARAFALTPTAVAIAAVYAEQPRSRQEREEARSATQPAPDTATASGGAPSESGDPFALAGIGRKATTDELWFAGWTRGPAERPR